jgi:hypothetical protein
VSGYLSNQILSGNIKLTDSRHRKTELLRKNIEVKKAVGYTLEQEKGRGRKERGRRAKKTLHTVVLKKSSIQAPVRLH